LVNDSEDKEDFVMPLLLLENSQDREEIVETKDWIDECLDEMEVADEMISWEEYRKIIEKYAPKTTRYIISSQKFTKEDVTVYVHSYSKKRVEHIIDYMV
jgi:hypothetical protein